VLSGASRPSLYERGMGDSEGRCERMPQPGAASFNTCTWCGDAVPPGRRDCPTCGFENSGQSISHLPLRAKKRIRRLGWLRALVVVAIVLAIAYAIGGAVFSGPPRVADPLTTQRTFVIPAGGYDYLAGAVTGEDIIVGNFTVLNPPSTQIPFHVYNSTEFRALATQGSAVPAATHDPSPGSPIVFEAPYTDTFYFVFSNPYPTSSGVSVIVYAATQYQPNVVMG
jgi:hypothetical protein